MVISKCISLDFQTKRADLIEQNGGSTVSRGAADGGADGAGGEGVGRAARRGDGPPREPQRRGTRKGDSGLVNP